MLHPLSWSVEGFGNGLLHQALLESRAHFAREDFDEVLGFDGRGLAKKSGYQAFFSGSCACARGLSDGFQCPPDLGYGKRPLG